MHTHTHTHTHSHTHTHKRCFFFYDFLISLVIQEFCRSFPFTFIFCIGKSLSYTTRNFFKKVTVLLYWVSWYFCLNALIYSVSYILLKIKEIIWCHSLRYQICYTPMRHHFYLFRLVWLYWFNYTMQADSEKHMSHYSCLNSSHLARVLLNNSPIYLF